jgi:hypothetical protein
MYTFRLHKIYTLKYKLLGSFVHVGAVDNRQTCVVDSIRGQ